MRKLSISLVLLGMTNFGLAQNSNPNIELSKFKDIDIVGADYEYLNEVQNDLTPNQVKYLENVVSFWDVSKSEKFDGRKGEKFNVTFKSDRDYIVASYDAQGELIRTKERFNNFAMPKSVSSALVKQFPNWKILKNRYSMLYSKRNGLKRSFKVLIKKGGKKKWLTIDSSGRIS